MNKNCLKCHKHEAMDDFDVCMGCSDDLDEMAIVSVCCDSRISESGLCYECKEHTESMLDEYEQEHSYCNKHGKYECTKHGEQNDLNSSNFQK